MDDDAGGSREERTPGVTQESLGRICPMTNPIAGLTGSDTSRRTTGTPGDGSAPGELHEGPKYSPGAREDYVRQLPENPGGRILDIGCANGRTGELALREKKCGYYCGVEVCEKSANVARGRISEVIVADIEAFAPPWPDRFFDVLILSEVLEHMRDPRPVLRKLHRHLKPGARVFASSPNVAHYSIIRMLLAGRWDVSTFGAMDEGHLRWFTPGTYREMFESCGYDVVEVSPGGPLGRKARVISRLLCHRCEYLFWRQIDLKACCRAAE